MQPGNETARTATRRSADGPNPSLNPLTYFVIYDNSMRERASMADEGFDGRPYRDTLKVPSILVMPGDPWPSEFYSRYPHAFRVPVRIVWRQGTPARDDGPPAPPAPPAASARQDGITGDRADEPAPEILSYRVSLPAAAAGSGSEHPIGAFLRINGFLDRLMGNPAPGSEGAQAEDVRKQQDPNTPIPFFDDRGTTVAIGLYAAAAGVSENDIKVRNTETGYKHFQEGRIK